MLFHLIHHKGDATYSIGEKASVDFPKGCSLLFKALIVLGVVVRKDVALGHVTSIREFRTSSTVGSNSLFWEDTGRDLDYLVGGPCACPVLRPCGVAVCQASYALEWRCQCWGFPAPSQLPRRLR